MEVIRENTVTTSLLAYEREVYIRTESNTYIRWNKELEPTLYEHLKSTGRWHKLSAIFCDFECDTPDLECKYQELKCR
jgi:hypothetical protein